MATVAQPSARTALIHPMFWIDRVASFVAPPAKARNIKCGKHNYVRDRELAREFSNTLTLYWNTRQDAARPAEKFLLRLIRSQ